MIALGAVYTWTGPITPSTVAPSPQLLASPAGASGILRFPDGSVVTPLEPDTDVVIDAVRGSAIELELVSGAARFEVTPGLPRVFRVQAGRATVAVVGTVFTVRRDGEGAIVEVERGRVQVTWDPDQSAFVSAGERGVFPRESEAVEAASVTASERPEVVAEATQLEVPAAPARPRSPRPVAVEEAVAEVVDEPVPEDTPTPPEPTPEWRSLADAGRFDEGYALLLHDRDVLRSDDVEALMQAADCARLSGHPAESQAYLRRAAEVGQGDPRAPVIAFTLGRVLLSQLSSPREAADEFARARALSPTGTLASDALAREVEAWSRAGEPERARERAEEYLRLYPTGLHTGAVRRFGGLE
jgi:transmembrane sensor